MGTGDSKNAALFIRNYSSDGNNVANGFGTAIQFQANRGSGGSSFSNSSKITGYVRNIGTGDYHSMDFDTIGDNGGFNRGITLDAIHGTAGGNGRTRIHGTCGINTSAGNEALRTSGEVLQLFGTGNYNQFTGSYGVNHRRDGGGANRFYRLSSSSGKLIMQSAGSFAYTARLSGNGAWASFTGAHDSKSETNEPIESGMIVCSTGKYIGEKRIDNSLPYIKKSTTSYDKSCYGVLCSIDPVEEDSEDFYTGEQQYVINSLGEGAIWVSNIGGNLESGDYITSSNVAGYGQKQDDDILHNYTVAKITTDCDFNPVTQPIRIIKKELQNIDYWVKTTYVSIAPEIYEKELDEDHRRIITETMYSNDGNAIDVGVYSNLESDVQSTYTEITKTWHQKIERDESKTDKDGYEHEIRQEMVNVLDESGHIQWIDDPSGATEKEYKIRYLDTNGIETEELNAVYIAAFTGCTYHCA
tara:strand:- start:691 stop:2103 length:1413 start_codon:yes stop_codon:yes gene_type:complete